MRPSAIMSFSLSLSSPLCLRHSCIFIMCWFKTDWLPKNHLTVPWQIWKKERLIDAIDVLSYRAQSSSSAIYLWHGIFSVSKETKKQCLFSLFYLWTITSFVPNCVLSVSFLKQHRKNSLKNIVFPWESVFMAIAIWLLGHRTTQNAHCAMASSLYR